MMKGARRFPNGNRSPINALACIAIAHERSVSVPGGYGVVGDLKNPDTPDDVG
jgi:hypothetical protein